MLPPPHRWVMHISRGRRDELPPPRRGRVGVGVTLRKAAERSPLSGWRRLRASVQPIGRASPPRPPHPDPPPPRGRECASGVARAASMARWAAEGQPTGSAHGLNVIQLTLTKF